MRGTRSPQAAVGAIKLRPRPREPSARRLAQLPYARCTPLAVRLLLYGTRLIISRRHLASHDYKRAAPYSLSRAVLVLPPSPLLINRSASS